MRAAAWLLPALVLGPASAYAQSGDIFNRTGSGARAAGMANAFIAISDDGTAASWNPAGLGQLRKPELSVVSTTQNETLASEAFRARDNLSVFTPATSSYTSTYLDFASVAVPFSIASKPTTFQASWRRQYALDTHDNLAVSRLPLSAQGPPASFLETNHDLTGSVDVLSLAAAIKLTPRLSLGASFNLWRGDWVEDRIVSQTTPALGGPTAFELTRQTNKVSGESLSLGLLLTYPRWSVGLLHQGPLSADFSGTSLLRTSASPESIERSAAGRLHFPRGLGFGGAYRPGARWTVALDMTWDEWKDTTLTLEGEPPVDLFDGLPPEISATRNTLSFNAGAEHLFLREGFALPIRFGAGWEPQGARSPYTLDPVSYLLLAAGAGYNTNSLKLDAAVQYRRASFLDGATYSAIGGDPYLPVAVGERTASSWTLKLSMILRVTDTDKLGRTIKKIFGGG